MEFTGPRQNVENIEKYCKYSLFSSQLGFFSKILLKAFLASTVSTKKTKAIYVNFERCKAIFRIVWVAYILPFFGKVIIFLWCEKPQL